MLRFLRRGKAAETLQAIPEKPQGDHEKRLSADHWIQIVGRRSIHDPYPGAWQQNKEITADDGLHYPVVFSCVTRIMDDISKTPLRVEKMDKDGIYRPDRENQLSRLLKRPNTYQDRQKFMAAWESSIQSRGNAYVFKVRGPKDTVKELHVLNPDLTKPMVSPSGAVFYRLMQDNIVGLTEERLVPASEIIHDRINCLFHPLVGLSPLYAAALNVWLGTMAQDQQQKMFANGATPGGVLIFPGKLNEETAKKVQSIWNDQYSGDNKGKTAILGDGVKYERLGVPAEDAQLIEQLRFGAEMICSVFHMPPYKVNIGPVPSIGGLESLNQAYFADCLQARITAIQSVLDLSFDLDGTKSAFRFDLDSLILMDTKTRFDIASGMAKGLAKLNESRKRMNLPPITGGDDIYMQQQDHSLAAIYERDQRYLAGDDTVPPVEPVAPVDTPAAPTELSDQQLAQVQEIINNMTPAKPVDLLQMNAAFEKGMNNE